MLIGFVNFGFLHCDVLFAGVLVLQPSRNLVFVPMLHIWSEEGGKYRHTTKGKRGQIDELEALGVGCLVCISGEVENLVVTPPSEYSVPTWHLHRTTA